MHNHIITKLYDYTNNNNGDCRCEEKSRKCWSLFIKLLSSVTVIFHILDQIKSNGMYWLHWKSEKNKAQPNELDELKYSKSLNQMASYAHWHAFLYLHAYIKTFIYLSCLKSEKKTGKWARILTNTLTDEQLCSLTCFPVFGCSNM